MISSSSMTLMETTMLSICPFTHVSRELLRSPAAYPVLWYTEEFDPSKDIFSVCNKYTI